MPEEQHKFLDQRHLDQDVARSDAFARLMDVTHKTANEATDLLWTTYHPYKLWYQFMAIGIGAAIAMVFYSIWVKKYEAPDI